MNLKPKNLLLSISNSLAVGDYATTLSTLKILSHRNINQLNDCIEKIKGSKSIADLAFRLEVLLFESEQKLNEQKTEEAQSLIEHVHVESIKHNYKKVEILALLQKAVLHSYLQKTDFAIDLLQQGEALANKLNEVETLIQVAIYGYHFYSETDTHKAGIYIFRALDLAKKDNNLYWQAYSLMHLGTLNTILSNHEAALNFFKEAFALFQTLQLNLSMADNLMCQFNIFYRLQEFDRAIACLEDAVALGENCGWDHKIAICYGNLSTVYLRLSRFDEAKQAAQKDIALSYKLNNLYNVGIATYRLGRIEAELGNTSRAIELLNESIQLRKNSITNNQLVQVYHHLMGYYAKLSDYKNAFDTQTNFMQLKFEILNAEKTKENEAQRAKYEAEKREAELKEARLQQTESELKALKAQMNPHFIFNALNSIQEIFFLGDKRLANKHLSNFSQLTRKILHASSKKSVTLQEEIEMLEQYLSLEALRFSGDFTYDIELTDSVDPYLIDIPPMLLQPFVENAVKHGLMHKENDRRLAINFSLEEKDNDIHLLLATIIDNGIGREASAKINANKKRIGQSFSSEATEKRLALLNTENYQNASVVYTDLAENNQPSGTCVLITIPVNF